MNPTGSNTAEKGNPLARAVRKATGLQDEEPAGLPNLVWGDAAGKRAGQLPLQNLCDGLSAEEWRDALDAVGRTPQRLAHQFQPIVDLRTERVCGFEALARFQEPPREGPEAWFAAADREGVADRLEARAIAAALESQRDLPDGIFLSINVSPGALVSAEVQKVLAQHADLDGLVLEITEQTTVRNYPQLNACLVPLRAAGVRIAVDDAGAGHSSLRQIVELEPDIVKIDRPLVSGVDRSRPRAAVVEAVSLLCERMGALAIAEGVERVEEARALSDLGVSHVQGYLFGRPQDDILSAHRTA